jgi:hypothetical protein
VTVVEVGVGVMGTESCSRPVLCMVGELEVDVNMTRPFGWLDNVNSVPEAMSLRLCSQEAVQGSPANIQLGLGSNYWVSSLSPLFLSRSDSDICM